MVAAALEKHFCRAAPGHNHPHFVAVVVVGNLFGGADQGSAEPSEPVLRIHNQRLNVRQRSGNFQCCSTHDHVAVARDEVLSLLVPNDTKVIKRAQRLAFAFRQKALRCAIV